MPGRVESVEGVRAVLESRINVLKADFDARLNAYHALVERFSPASQSVVDAHYALFEADRRHQEVVTLYNGMFPPVENVPVPEPEPIVN